VLIGHLINTLTKEPLRKRLESVICYNPVKNFVDKEIEKGISPYLAIDKVLNSKGLEKMYQELKNDAVKRTIRNILLNKYFRDTNKEKEEEKETEGEER